jgi:hypothetical protein
LCKNAGKNCAAGKRFYVYCCWAISQVVTSL